MSILSKAFKKIGSGAKKLVTNPVKWAENAGRSVGGAAKTIAPYAGLIPGVGTGIGALLGAGGSILAGDNMASHLKSGAAGALSGLGNAKLLGGKGIGGLVDLAKNAGGMLSAPGGGVAGAVKSGVGSLVAGAAKKGIGISDILKGGIGLAGGISGLVSANKAGKAADAASGRQSAIADELVSTGRAMNARAAPLADSAAAGLLARLKAGPRATPDFSQFIDRANPFSAQFAPPPVPLPAPVAPAMLQPPLPRKLLPRRLAAA